MTPTPEWKLGDPLTARERGCLAIVAACVLLICCGPCWIMWFRDVVMNGG